MTSMGYLKVASRGFGWMGALRGSTRALALVKILILARILTPSQFGVYGIATIVLGLLEMMTETGVNVFLIQKKEKINDYVSTAWFVSVIRGIIISSLIIASTPLIVTFFNEPSARGILYAVSWVPFIRGLINPAIVKFQKELKFHKVFAFELTLFLIDTAVAVYLGIVTASEVSLIWGMVAAATFEVALSFILVKPRPSLSFNLSYFKEVISVGKWITGAGIFNYLFHHIDDIVVGRILGSAALGVYQQAYRISTLPISEVGEVVNKVTFPVYVSIEADKDRLKKAFTKTSLFVLGSVATFGTLIFLFAERMVPILLGDGWSQVVAPLKILTVFGVIKAIGNSAYSLLLSVGMQKMVAVVSLTGVVILGVIIYPLTVSFGLIGSAVATVIASVASLPVIAYALKKAFSK